MKSVKASFLLLVLLLIPDFILANEGHLDLSLPSRIVLAKDGHYIIEAKQGFEGLEYRIEAKDRKGEAAQGLLLVTKPSKEGTLIRINKEPGSRGYTGTPKIFVTLDSMHDIFFDNVEGDYAVLGIRGAVSGTMKKGKIELNSCAGPVQLKVKRGTINVTNYLSENQPFELVMKQGNIHFEFGKTTSPGPGSIALGSGRIQWSMKEQIPVHFHGEVKDGLVTCNLPITRPDPKVITFTSMGGKMPWRVLLNKGMLRLQLPKPR